MNIGIDIDDTITDTYDMLIPLIAMHYDINLNKLLDQKPTYKMLDKTLHDFAKFKRDTLAAMGKIVPLKKGVNDVLSKLREEGHKIIFITARNYNEYEDPYKITFEYLKANNVPFDKLLVDVKDKASACVLEGIDLFIDDNTLNCKAVQNKGIGTLQFDAKFLRDIKALKRVYSWEEIYKIVKDMCA